MTTFTIKHDNPKRSDVCRLAVQEMQRWHEAGRDFEVVVREPRRNNDQSALFHALVGEVARKKEWDGEMRSPEAWKRLFVASWCRATNKPAMVLRALDGSGVDIVPAKTKEISRSECSELVEFVLWWGTENGVRWDAREG